MEFYRNLGIKTKLIAGFAIIAALAVILGIVGVANLGSIASNNEKIYEQSAVPITYLSRIQTAFQQSRVSVRDMIRATKVEDIEKEIEIITAQRADAAGVMEQLGESISNDSLRLAYNLFAEARVTYGEQLDKIIELGRANGDGSAYAMMANATVSTLGKDVPPGSFTQAATAYREKFQDLEAALLKEAEEVKDASAKSASAATAAMAVLCVVVGGLGIGLGFVIATSISAPLKKSLHMIQEMGRGHLSIRLGIKSRDEVGLMAQAMDAFADDMQKTVIGTMKRIADGDMTASIEPHDADDEIVPALKTTISTVHRLVSETNSLIEAAVEGRLDTRARTSGFNGSWKELLTGFNKVLETVVLPINEASAVLAEMAEGNLSLRMEGDYKGDYAVIKKSMNQTLDALSAYVGEISTVLTAMAGSDIDVEIRGEYRGDFSAIKIALNLIADNFNQILHDMNIASEQVSAGAHQVADGSQSLSQGATEQASSVEELTSSINEIADQTRQNALSANEANELAATALTAATQGNTRMKEMQKAMEEINESSASISKIIKVIDDIAFQTNILALNAAVEAAHAGQYGKGFAVVAEEVRNLAAKSAAAAKETSGMIEGSIKKVEIGTRIADDTAKALDIIVGDVAKAAELVGAIAVASNEQATGIAQINQGVEQVSKVVQANSSTAEQSAQASEELSGQAELLQGMIDRFNLRPNVTDTPATKSIHAVAARKPEPKAAAAEPAPETEGTARPVGIPEGDAPANPPKGGAIPAQAPSKSDDKGKSDRGRDIPAGSKQPKPKITLSDNEFGKY